MTKLEMYSTSRATDGAWSAAADVAAIGRQLDIPYRLVGGIAVTMLVHYHGVADRVPERETADADMGVRYEVCSDPRLLPALLERGYQREDGSRLSRTDGDRELVIDLLTPSYTGRMQSNQAYGQFTVDEVPGLALALAAPSTDVMLAAVFSDGAHLQVPIALPDVRAALCIKAYAYRDRIADRDAVDIVRLLEAAVAGGHSTSDWGTGGTRRDAAQILYSSFVLAGGSGARRLGSAELARVQALIVHLVPEPGSMESEG